MLPTTRGTALLAAAATGVRLAAPAVVAALPCSVRRFRTHMLPAASVGSATAAAAAAAFSSVARSAAAPLSSAHVPPASPSASPEWVRCFVAIGSNAGHRARNLHAALSLLQRADPERLVLSGTSFLYESTPVGSPPEHASQPRFLNGVLDVRTRLPPLQLLDTLKGVEAAMGRDAHMVRNGPRLIDLDIIMYDSPDFTFAHSRLQIPHPRWSERGFVLVPLIDLVGAGGIDTDSSTATGGGGSGSVSSSTASTQQKQVWGHVVHEALVAWRERERRRQAEGTETEGIYRVIPFPNAVCVPDAPSPAISDVWRWGRQHGAEPAVASVPVPSSVHPASAPTLIMGILNLTPDSFSDGGVNLRDGVQGAVDRAKRLWNAGADIIDIGGESTRPGSTPLTADEELARILPVIDALHAQHPFIKLSVDTYHPRVAREAVLHGCVMINDVYGGTFRESDSTPTAAHSESMLDVAASLNVPYCCMHMRGTAQVMTSKEHQTYTDVVREVLGEQQAQCSAALATRAPIAMELNAGKPATASSARSGSVQSAAPLSSPTAAAGAGGAAHSVTSPLYRWNLIADPGIGFAKTPTHSLQLLHSLRAVRPHHLPLLVGTSRKGFISRVLSKADEQSGLRRAAEPRAAQADGSMTPMADAPHTVTAAAREWGTGATVAVSIMGGADIVRVHDVEAMRAIRDVTDAICRK